jgi:hypothetical protein
LTFCAIQFAWKFAVPDERTPQAVNPVGELPLTDTWNQSGFAFDVEVNVTGGAVVKRPAG